MPPPPGPGGPGCPPPPGPGPGGPGGPPPPPGPGSGSSSTTIDSYTNKLGAYTSVNADKICYYQEWKLKCNGETAYHILGIDGTTVCIYESEQAGGVTVTTSSDTLSTDYTCGWDGYIVGTFTPFN